MAVAASAISPFPAGITTGGASALATACGSNTPGIACRLVWDLSHSAHAASFTTVYLEGPVRLILRIGFVLLLAVLLRIAAARLIRRLTVRAAGARSQAGFGPGDAALAQAGLSPGDPAAAQAGLSPGDQAGVSPGEAARHRVFGERRSQRATALASVLGNAASVTIFSVAAVIILGDLGLNLAPVLASAGVLGIAIGFGAQNLVKDFLAGIFMLLEDQYGVGDLIDIGSVAGTVEGVSLRITRLRDINGVVWHVRNGTIKRSGNETHGWARAVVDFPVPYQLPVSAARGTLERAAVGMWEDPVWHLVMLDRPQVWGVEDVSADTVLIRVAVRTAPQGRLEVTRELRERLKEALDASGGAGASLAGPVLADPVLADSVPQQPEPPLP